MGEVAMELSDEQFVKLTDVVVERMQEKIPEILSGASTTGSPVLFIPKEFWDAQVELRTSIKAIQNAVVQINTRLEVFEERFKAIDQRFEAVDKRFEAMDKRFDDLIHFMDKRFEAVDKRFSSLQWFIGIGFSLIVALMSVYRFVS